MKRLKRAVSYLLIAAMLFSCAPVSAVAEPVPPSDPAPTVSNLPEPTTAPTSEPTMAPTPEPTTAPTPGPTTDPDTTDPDTTDPDATDPDATDPDATDPDATDPDTTDPDATDPDATDPDTTDPDATDPDTTDDRVTALCQAHFAVAWSNAAYSRVTPDIIAGVKIYAEDGSELSGLTYDRQGDQYLISGIPAGGNYALYYDGRENEEYSCSSLFQLLRFDELSQCYVADQPIPATLKTYSFSFSLSLPEGFLLPDDYNVKLMRNGEEIGSAVLKDGSFTLPELYVIDGNYSLVFPEIQGLELTESSYALACAVSSLTPQAASFAFERRSHRASFAVYWQDDANLSERRDVNQLRQQLALFANGSALAFSELTAEAAVSEVPYYEKVIYTIHGLPGQLDETSVLSLCWGKNALPEYENSDYVTVHQYATLSRREDPLSFTASPNGSFIANTAWCMVLPSYPVSIKVEGLDEPAAAELLQNLRITRMDLNTGELVPYPYASASFDRSVLYVRNLYTRTPDGLDAFYCITFPVEFGSFSLEDPDMMQHFMVPEQQLYTASTRGGEESGRSVRYLEKVTTYSASGTASSQKNILWYEPDAAYSHNGEFVLEVPVTLQVHGTEITRTYELHWDETAACYQYQWTRADLVAMGLTQKSNGEALTDEDYDKLLEKLAPLTVTDNGTNNLNRVLEASTSGNLKITVTQYNQSSTVLDAGIVLGNIEIRSFNYEPNGRRIQEYVPHTLEINGVPTIVFYPFVDISFAVEFRKGGEPVNDADIEGIVALTGMYNNEYLPSDVSGMTAEELSTAQVTSSRFTNPAYPFCNYGFSYVIRDHVRRVGDTYIVRVPLFEPYPNKNQVDYSFISSEYHPVGSDHYYRIEYDNKNAFGHGTVTDRVHDGGSVILIRTGKTNFQFTKKWLDVDPAERPNASYRLYRYTANGGDYTTASQIDIPIRQPDGTISYIREGLIPREDESTITLEGLDRYDGEGYPFVYFIVEDLPGTAAYEKIFGEIIVQDDGQTVARDTLPYEGERKTNDPAVYHTGTITNCHTDVTSIHVTKTWKAAHYQDSLNRLSVKMSLYSRIKGDSSQQAQWVQDLILSGFDAYNPSKSGTVVVSKFDSQGRELEYFWRETAVVEQTADGPVERPVENGQVVLPMNQANMDSTGLGEKCEIEESFVAAEESPDHFVNTLRGQTRYHIRKTWSPDVLKSDVVFQLYQIGKDGAIVPYNGYTYTLPADSPYYKETEAGVYDSGWILAFEDLPLYDENGNLIYYLAREEEIIGSFPVYGYNNDVDSDGISEPNSLLIHNGPGDGRTIKLRKIWLDDSATAGRDTVYMDVYAESGVKLYGTGSVVNLSSVPVSAGHNWMSEVSAAFYTNGTDWALVPQENDPTWQLYSGDFYVKESSVGDAPVAPEANAPYTSVVSNGTRYAVIYHGNGGATYNIEKTDSPDQDGFYTVTNLRIGTSQIEVKKVWKDDVTVDRGSFEANILLLCTDDNTRLKSEGGYAYARIHPALSASGWIPVMNDSSEQVPLSQSLNTGDASRPDVEQVYFFNMPLYDENGKILHYEVEETVTVDGTETGSYKVTSSGVQYQGSGNAYEHYGIQTITNTYEKREDVVFHLLWLDQYRASTQLRPDIYLTLYHTVYQYQEDGTPVIDPVSGEPKKTVEPYGFEQYIWGGVNAQISGDFWSYTFRDMPVYDSHGNKISYYASIRSNEAPGKRDYLNPQYSLYEGSGNLTYDAFLLNRQSIVTSQPDGSYTVSHIPGSPIVVYPESFPYGVMQESNSFVMQVKTDIIAQGRKIWENVPVGFPTDNLPKVNFLLKRLGNSQFGDQLDVLITGENYVAAILDASSPSIDYTFYMGYIGLNDLNGNLIPADATVSVQLELDNGMTYSASNKPALEVWLDLTGVSDENRAVISQFYGQCLTKYNERGALYQHTILESYIVPDTEGYQSGRLFVQQTHTSNNADRIVNTVLSNKQSISFSKDWTRNDDPIPEDFVFPSMEVSVFRFVQVENGTAAGFSPIEKLATQTLTAQEVKALATGTEIKPYAVFSDLEVYAPNGNRFIYFVGEHKINGYNTGSGQPLINIDGVEPYTGAAPAETERDPDYWYSGYFTLVTPGTAGQTVVPADAQASMANDHTAMEQTELTGSKSWFDYSNQFSTRPDELTFALYRRANGMGEKQKAATITLNKDGDHSIAMLPELNLTSEVSENVPEIEANDHNDANNKWGFKVIHLDKYASNGNPWIYSIEEETVPTGYNKSGSGLNLTNRMFTAVEVMKEWDKANLNQELSYPSVRVELYVSIGESNVWQKASTYFGSSAFTENNMNAYQFEKKLYHPHWREYFAELPVGVVIDGHFVEYKYRVVETGIYSQSGDVENDSIVQEITPNSDLSTGVGGSITVTMTTGTNNRGEQLDTIKNSTDVTELKVTKQWEDLNNGYDTRYVVGGNWIVRYHVYRSTATAGTRELLRKADGTPYVLTVSGSTAANATTLNQASATLTGLMAESPTGEAYIYSVVELNPDVSGQPGSEVTDTVTGGRYNGAYQVSYSDENGEITVTNKLLLTELSVTKDWVGDSEAGCAFRPDSITLTLKRNDSNLASRYVRVANATLVWTKNDNQWTASYVNLPKYAPNGNAYRYRVEEARQSGYLNPSYVNTQAGEDNLHKTSIINTATQIMLNKVNTQDESINNVTLVFEGNGVKLTWSRDANGLESYQITRGTETISSGSSNAGAVIIRGLPLGTYTLKQEILPDGYYFSAKNAQFSITSTTQNAQTPVRQGLIRVSGDVKPDGELLHVQNKKTTLTFEKRGISGSISEGWVFTLTGEFTDAAGVTTKMLASANDFAALEGLLIVGKEYTLVETRNPDGYVLSDAAVRFTLNENNSVVLANAAELPAGLVSVSGNKILFTDPDFGLVISKLSTGVPGKPLPDAQFHLYVSNDQGLSWTRVKNAAGTEDLILKTNGAGEVTLRSTAASPKLVASNDASASARYYLEEIKAPDGYKLPDTHPKAYFRFLADGTAVGLNGTAVASGNKFSFTDEPIEISLFKRDGGDVFASENALAGVQFRIAEGDNADNGQIVTSDGNGEIQFSPIDGRFTLVGGRIYTIKEVQKAGYTILPPFTFKVETNGTLRAVDEKPLPAGVSIEDSRISIRAVNERVLGTVVLTKASDVGDYSLKDAQFGLYRKAEGNWLDKLYSFLTGKQYDLVWNSDGTIQENSICVTELTDGQIILTGLPWGEYKLEEEVAPNGFKLENKSFLFEISPNGQIAHYALSCEGNITNEHFSYRFTKHVKDGNAAGRVLPGATFKLEEYAGDTLVLIKENLVSDQTGTVTIQSVEEAAGELQVILTRGKTYRITETRASDGYKLPEPAPWVELRFDAQGNPGILRRNEAYVTENGQFLNDPISFRLVKYDGGDSFANEQPLKDVHFTIAGPGIDNGISVHTDSDGVIRFGLGSGNSFVPVGGTVYTLTEETVSGRGYHTLDTISFMVRTDGNLETVGDLPEGVTLEDNKLGIKAVNTRILGKVTLRKTSTDGDTLDNVVFELYRQTASSSWLNQIMEFVTGKSYELLSSFGWGSSNNVPGTSYTIAEGNDGELVISGLEWGTYKLVETAAEGYKLSENEAERTHIFTIGPNAQNAEISLDQTLEVTNEPNRVKVRKINEQNTVLSGAVYELHAVGTDGSLAKISNNTDAKQAMWVWNADSGIGEASCLPAGTYLLRETWAPKGYVLAKDIYFTIDVHGTVKINGSVCSQDGDGIPLIDAVDKKTLFTFTKAEMYNESCSPIHGDTRILPGVTFTAYEDEACTNVLATAVSDSQGVVSFVGLPMKDHLGVGTETPVYIRETETVSGHVLDTRIYKVYVDSSLNDQGVPVSNSGLIGDNQERVAQNTVINDVYRADFRFTKVSEYDHGKAIPGAVYGLYKSVDTAVGPFSFSHEIEITRAIADEEGQVVFAGLLMDVEYTIKEISVPAGSWLSKNPISFRYTWKNGAAELTITNDGEGTILSQDRLIWQEPQTKLSILKVNSHGIPLPGAKLQLRDTEGNIVQVPDGKGNMKDYWISGNNAFEITGIVKAGESYWLYELSAPQGYLIAAPKRIKVPESTAAPGENLQIPVKMFNYTPTDAPRTGDFENIALYMSLLGTSLLGALAALKLGKRRKRGKH